MAMTKEEIYKTIRQHRGDITNTLLNLDFALISVIRGSCPQADVMIDALKESMNYVKDRADDVKSLLGEWE